MASSTTTLFGVAYAVLQRLRLCSAYQDAEVARVANALRPAFARLEL
ncbi:MAG TPA: hypothetical protein VFU22_10040 [Roseiflexaceae bacterium]|nr:hypothetical protein [Roseiflexaceae bacterium]